jgi:hypothetical protein
MIKYLSRMLASYGIWRMRARQNRRRESWKPSSLLPVAYCTVLSAVLPLLADFGGGGVKDGRAQISPRQPCWVDSLVPALFTSLLVQLICIPSLLLATIQYSPVWPTRLEEWRRRLALHHGRILLALLADPRTVRGGLAGSSLQIWMLWPVYTSRSASKDRLVRMQTLLPRYAGCALMVVP